MIDAELLRKDWPLANDGSDYWYLCKPLSCCLRHRLRDAWEVLKGRAEAVKFRL